MQIWDLLSVIHYIHDTYWKLDTNMNKFQLLTALGVFMLFFGWSHGAHESDQSTETKRFLYRSQCRAPIVYDFCKRECKCKDGRLYDCHRVRREFSTLSYEDRLAYVDAVKIVSTLPPFKQEYEKLLTIHKTHFNSTIHQFQYFLPWHRWFLLEYESLLRRVNCRITVPYWDYTLTAGQPFTGLLWSNTKAGLGGNGEGLPRSCVKNGPFQEGKWNLIESAGGGCLKRHFFQGINFPDLMALQQVQSTFSSASRFRDFELVLRNNLHNDLHLFIGGTMAGPDSAAAPEFFPLHSMVDKIWDDWQKKSARHMYPPEFLYQRTKMLGIEYYSRDFLNLSKQPRCTAVKYAVPNKKNKTIERLTVHVHGPSAINQIPRRIWAKLRKETVKMFHMKPAEQKRLKVLLRRLTPKFTLKQNSLHGAGRKLGFSVKKVKQIADASGKYA